MSKITNQELKKALQTEREFIDDFDLWYSTDGSVGGLNLLMKQYEEFFQHWRKQDEYHWEREYL